MQSGGDVKTRLRRRLFRTTATAAVILAAGAAAGASAPAHASGERITASTPTENRIVYGQPILMTVNVQADSLFSGTINVYSENLPGQTRPIELAGGTAKELTIIAPPLYDDTDKYRIELLDQAGNSVAKMKLASSLDLGDSVVGVFPTLNAGMPDAEQSPIGPTSYLYPFEPSQFEFAAAGVAAYDVLVATPDDLSMLDEASLAAVNVWLVQGGRLIIDGAASDIAKFDLPQAWTPADPGDSSRQSINRGEVYFSGGAIANGDWSLATAPVPSRSIASAGFFGSQGMFGSWGGESVTNSLAEFTNSAVLPTATLALAIGLYALVVGPGLFFIFRRHRSRIWLAAPLLAMVATTGVLLLGRAQQAKIIDSYGAVVSVEPIGSTTTAWSLRFARTRGSQSLELPPQFLPYQTPWESGELEVDNRPGGNVVTQKVASGSFGLFGALGPSAQFDNGVSATATHDGKKLIGTVTNHLAVTLSDVAVFWNANAVNVGDLKPGATAEFELKRGDPVQFSEAPPWIAWPNAVTDQMREFQGRNGLPQDPDDEHPEYDPDTEVSFGLWDDFIMQHSADLGSPDQFAVGGWTRELPNPLDSHPDGKPTVGTTLVATIGQATRSDGEASGQVGVISVEELNVMNGPWTLKTLLRMSTPTATGSDAPTELELIRPSDANKVEVFLDGKWVKLNDAHKPVRLPAHAVDPLGAVYVRAEISPQNETVLPSLVLATPNDKSVDFTDALENGS